MKRSFLDGSVRRFLSQQESSGTLPPGAGIAVCALEEGQVCFQGTYGRRERDRNLPVTPHTVFEICSLTKTFTATALSIASDEGQVQLDQPINAARELLALRDPEVSRTFSLADVLSHRTGLASNDLLWYFGSLERDALLGAVGRLDLVPDAFRKTFIYNNLLYGAVGHLFGPLVGRSWEESVTAKLLSPLNMTSTSFRATPFEQDVALPYAGTRRIERFDMSAVAAAGAMRSTLEDMTRWMAFQLAGGRASDGARLLSEAAVERMREKQIAFPRSVNPLIFQGLEWLGEDLGYGFGWCVGSTRGHAALFHPGFVDGFSAALVMIPALRLGFVVLTNVNLSPVPGLLIQALLGGLLDEDEQPSKPSPDEGRAAMDAALTGRFEHDTYGALSIQRRGAQLVVEYGKHAWPLTLQDEHGGTLAMTLFGMQVALPVQFERDDHRVTQLALPLSMDPRVAPQRFVRSPGSVT